MHGCISCSLRELFLCIVLGRIAGLVGTFNLGDRRTFTLALLLFRTPAVEFT